MLPKASKFHNAILIGGLTFGLMLVGGSAAAAADANWQVTTAMPDDTAPASYCSLKANLDQGARFILARDLSGSASAAISGIDNLKSNKVNLSIYNYYQKSIQAVAGDAAVMFNLGHDDAFFNGFRRGQEMHFSGAGFDYTLNLAGSANALIELNDCLREINGGRSLPWQKAKTDVPMPPLNAQNQMTMSEYFANNASRLNRFNDPRGTYIHVHKPGELSYKKKEITSSYIGEPKAASEALVDRSYADLVCRASDAPSYLRHVIDTEMGNVIELVTNDEGVVTAASEPLSYSWEHQNVSGNFLTAPTNIDVLEENIFRDLENACLGDFARQAERREFIAGLFYYKFNLACYDGQMETIGQLNLISDGLETAVFSFETDAGYQARLDDAQELFLNWL